METGSDVFQPFFARGLGVSSCGDGGEGGLAG
jgi:hypothetical protein